MFKLVRWIDIYIGIPLVYLLFYLKKINRKTKNFNTAKNYKKILFVKFWGIGNIIMLLPSIYALKKKYPTAKLNLLTLYSNKNASEAVKAFDNIYIIDAKSISGFIITSLKNFIKLKRENHDLIIDFEQFSRLSAIFCSLIGKNNLIGFKTEGQHRDFLYTSSIAYNDNTHITKSFYSLVEFAGTPRKNYIKAIPIVCKQQDINEIENRLRTWGIFPKDIIVLLHVGTSDNFNLRRWPTKSFADLSDRLIDKFDVKIVFTGLRKESLLVKEIISYMKNKKTVIDASGTMNFKQFVSLIKLGDLIISADTAPVHIASCLSVPIVGLYGPNSPFLYGPWGNYSIWFYKNLNCSPCITNYNTKLNKCSHSEGKGICMKKISPDEVFLGIKNNYFDPNGRFRLRKLNRNE